MYLIGRLCVGSKPQRQSRVSDFDSALPRLRDVAATDRRLAPGYWWPMSGEAEDVICCIETGMSPESDASDRWPDTTKRGKYGED
jgi:hypothetical protein